MKYIVFFNRVRLFSTGDLSRAIKFYSSFIEGLLQIAEFATYTVEIEEIDEEDTLVTSPFPRVLFVFCSNPSVSDD